MKKKKPCISKLFHHKQKHQKSWWNFHSSIELLDQSDACSVSLKSGANRAGKSSMELVHSPQLSISSCPAIPSQSSRVNMVDAVPALRG